MKGGGENFSADVAVASAGRWNSRSTAQKQNVIFINVIFVFWGFFFMHLFDVVAPSELDRRKRTEGHLRLLRVFICSFLTPPNGVISLL